MKWLGPILLGSLLAVVPAPGPVQDEAQLAAARQLLQSLDMPRIMARSMESAMDVQIKANAALTPYRDVMLSWADTYLSWAAFEPKVTELYAQAFTAEEMQELIAFYSTPTGRKSVEKLPELMAKGAEIGASLAQQHQPELMQMIEKRRKELDGK